MFTAISSLPTVNRLEVTQPAVTPDLLLLRLFYRDFIETFPDLKLHDLVWRSVQGEYKNCSENMTMYNRERMIANSI